MLHVIAGYVDREDKRMDKQAGSPWQSQRFGHVHPWENGSMLAERRGHSMRRGGIGIAFGTTTTSSLLFEKHLVSFFWPQRASKVRQYDGAMVSAH